MEQKIISSRILYLVMFWAITGNYPLTAQVIEGHHGPKIFGGKLEHPSEAKLDLFRRQAIQDLSPYDIELPPSQTHPNARALPSDATFSWRKSADVTPARNQKDCGSCFVFGTVAAFEGNWAIQHNHQMIHAAEQPILNCVADGCEGGYISEVANYLLTNGTCIASDDSYRGQKQACLPVPIAYQASACDYVATNGQLPSIVELKRALLTHGPIAVFVYADGFENFYNSDEVISSDSQAGGHVVVITGWDNTKSYPGGTGAWEIKNSWGPEWGRNGLGYVAYTVREIGYNAMWMETSVRESSRMILRAGRKALDR